ncbi:MAG TPA: aldo/keto reductase [Actinomycetota bacterium]|nr:aldo/keto reductase [Actinomycetota bacterium]
MEYRALGSTGTLVSELCLGCMTFGRELDEDGSGELIKRFVDAGGNFLDTADVYSRGSSEEITGRAIKSMRDDLVVATKVRFPMGDGPNDVGASRKHIMAGAEATLRRLDTDYIDLYQIHCWDALTPLEETLSALTDLVRQGKVRYLGISNFTGWQIMKAMAVSDAHGFERFVTLQPQYSLVERNLEYELVPVCLDQGLGILPWGPLGGGFVSGKYRKGEQPPEGSRIADATSQMEESWERRSNERNWRIIDVLGSIAEETDKSYSQVALNWLLNKPGVTAPILGARKLEQLEDNLGASGWRLDDKQMQRLDEVSEPPPLYPYAMIAGSQRA